MAQTKLTDGGLKYFISRHTFTEMAFFQETFIKVPLKCHVSKNIMFIQSRDQVVV